jgi:hypothetical protein
MATATLLQLGKPSLREQRTTGKAWLSIGTKAPGIEKWSAKNGAA